MIKQSSLRHPFLGLIGLSLMASVGFLDFTIVYTALPAIQRAFNVPVIELQWIMTIFSLILATLMVFSGKLADIFGKRRVFYIGVFLFGVAAVGAGTAVSFLWLVFFRALQGVGATIIFTSAAALAPSCVPSDQQSKAIGVYSAITGLGLAIGPFIGGLLVGWFNWRWIFFINIPVIIIGFLLCIGNVPEMPKQKNTTIDWLGLCLFIIAISTLIYSITNLSKAGLDHITFLGFIVAILAFIALCIAEKHIVDPFLSITDAKNPKILLGIILCATASIMTNGVLFLAPLFLTNILDVSAITLGLLMLCTPLMQVLVSAAWNVTMRTIGIYKAILIAVGALLASILIQIFFNQNTSLFLVIIAFSLMGIIWGVTNTSVVTLAYQAVPIERTSSIIGLIFSSWNTTGTIMLVLTSSIFTTSEFHKMQTYLLTERLHLSPAQHEGINVILSNPSEAHVVKLLDHSAEKLLPLIKASFLYGYQNTLLFFLALLVPSLIFVAALIYKISKTPN